MKFPFIPAIAVSTFLIFGTAPISAEEPVRVQGVASLTRALKSAVPQLKEMGIEIRFGEECSNSQAVAALGAGEIDLALLGRVLSSEERASYPEKHFEEFQIGVQAVALIVSRTIWEGGIQALKREQVAELYEGRALSWKRLGGEDRPAKFFEPAHGSGVWEIFATWLYGDMRKAPAVPWEIVTDGADAQTAVEFHSGALTVAALRWADRKHAFPLAIIDDAGETIEPTPANVAAGKYPMSRPAFILIGDKPTGQKRRILEFLRGEQGQAAMVASDLLPYSSLQEP